MAPSDNQSDDWKNMKGLPANEDIVENAGQIILDPPQMWGTGIISDFRKTVGTYWIQEMTNFNQKTLAVGLFLFIAIVAPTLAFGANYGKMSNQQVGTVETILATSWVGCAYALIGGMPMAIIGSTGPALAISTAIKGIADSIGVSYLVFNAWVSIWLAGYCFICAFFDLTRYIKLATRFTDEIFALLIVAIFVIKAIGDPFSPSGLLRYLQSDHKSHNKFEDDADYDYMPVALLSIIIGFGTTTLIFFFRSFKFSPYFCSDGIRTTIHDFSVLGSVIIFTLIKEVLFSDVKTEQLNVPASFEPTFQCCDSSCETYWPTDCPDVAESFGTRPWFVNLFDLKGKGWVPIAAAGPGIMALLLNYLDCGITWHLIYAQHLKLEHGPAYNYDLMLVGFFNCINGLMGLPWLVASTVPCIIHVNALAEKDAKGNILSVQETRLTAFLAHALLGLSMLFLNVIKLIPMPVLLGVFLFMGLSALPSMELWQRFLLWFMQPSKYPENHMTKYIEKGRIHKYTVFQLCFFFGVWVVLNVKSISIAFPFMTFLCIPARLYFAPVFFAGWELALLDGDDDMVAEWVQAKQESIRNFEKNNDKTTPDEMDV